MRAHSKVPELSSIPQLENLGHEVLSLMIRHDQLRPFINSIITEQELESIKLSESEQQQALNIYSRRHNLNSGKDVKIHCQKHGFNENQFGWQVQLQERVLRSSKNRFADKAELHYLTRKEQFDQVSYSQLIVKDLNLAHELILRLKEDGAKFNDLVLELTRNVERRPQWKVGPIPLARVPQPLSKPLQTAKPGSLLGPINVQGNWFVVRLEQYRPTEFDATMEQRMCLELFQRHVDTLVDQHMAIITANLSQNNTTISS